MLVLEDE
jgi:hypothetical protein